MKTYGIETKWNGTQYYMIGKCKNRLHAYLRAIKEYKWFRCNPDYDKIKAI